MLKSDRIQIHVFLLCLALLIGQLGALLHSAEHPFHEVDQSCQVFNSLEKSDNVLADSILRLPGLPKSVFSNQTYVHTVLPELKINFHPRAPPSFI